MSADIKTVSLTVAVPLRQFGDEKRAIEFKLNRLISQYIPEADGILIKWSDLDVIDSKGNIIDDQPYIFWRVTFTAQVFKAIEGKIVKGKVDRVQKCYFIAKAMNSFTVTVSIPDSLAANKTIQGLMVEQDVYFKLKGSSDGVYRGEIDEECLELTRGCLDQSIGEDKNVYDYSKDFEY